MKNFIVILVVFIAFASCKKEQENNPLKGTWVRRDNPTDTLTFGIEFSDTYIVMKRGFELRNGHILPKSGSGPYAYQIVKDSIDLLPAWSSSMVFHRYFFRVKGNEMEIGDFFDGTKQIIHFSKK